MEMYAPIFLRFLRKYENAMRMLEPWWTVTYLITVDETSPSGWRWRLRARTSFSSEPGDLPWRKMRWNYSNPLGTGNGPRSLCPGTTQMYNELAFLSDSHFKRVKLSMAAKILKVSGWISRLKKTQLAHLKGQDILKKNLATTTSLWKFCTPQTKRFSQESCSKG